MNYRGPKWSLTAVVGIAAAIAIAIMMMTTGSATVQDTRNSEESNRALIARSFEAWRTGTGSPYDLLAPDASWTITGRSVAAKTYPTREAFMSEVIRPFNARMRSRLVPSVRHLYAESDTVVAFFDASGTARDGRLYDNTYAWILEMKDGRIIRAYAFFDSIAFNDLWHRVQPTPGE
ncbi:MAG TPA: nuclear transport factor 2 family protein [Pyrinomonadaceae bacterium]|nr:nuclear transport factor 2 family protein [Pyrinomonadaceae bacterium]